MAGVDLFYYIVCCVVVIGTLAGIAMMSKVKTAVTGNQIGALSILIAIVLTLWYNGILTVIPLLIVMLISLVVSAWWSTKVKMIVMPQMVATLNGFGGAASAIVGGVYLVGIGAESTMFTDITSGLAIAVGMITLFGSVVAVGKLSGKLDQKPVILPLHQLITTVLLVISLVMIGIIAWGGIDLWLSLLLIYTVSGLFGIVFAIRVGGADMPITISLLNSLTGIACSAAGMSVGDPLLIAVGGIVGAAGLLLTQIMCRGMNRSLLDILLGKTTVVTASVVSYSGSSDHISKLKKAKRVLVVPGYGMAVAQAQGLLKELSGILEENDVIVDFSIHPVAGRAAGHMNVLLADADIPYEKLREADELDADIAQYDVAIVVGANDVVNPAAREAKDTPIYGLPIIAVDKINHIIICNYDKKPGYAGVDNPLYESDKVTLLIGDASDTLRELIDKLSEDSKKADTTEETERAGKLLSEASKVIIIPGYGMALAGAQGLVKELSVKLTNGGATVDFAIHPVAGRMPGHMNVLLAEVDVSYDKLREMNDINPGFAECDVAVIIGANDVVNPAARDAVGTPIYGMPILSADEAKNIIVCNFDTKPGYAGVDNPLYKSSKVTLLLGDAAKTLKDLIGKL